MAELIVAFDLPNGREALALAARLSGLRWAKIGPVLYNREGPVLIKEFTQRGIRVFLDLKWHDIPNIVASAVTGARELGVSMTTVHCLGGRTMLAAAAGAAGPDLALVGVTVLTSHDAAELESVLGRGVPDVGFEAERLARLAQHAGLRGVVASGQALELLRRYFRPAEERGLDITAIREVEAGKGFVELTRRYVIAGTTELRRETLYLGYRLLGREWRL